MVWFGVTTRQATRRISFSSVNESVSKIDLSVKHHNANTKPFVWTATADSIFATVQRRIACIGDTMLASTA